MDDNQSDPKATRIPRMRALLESAFAPSSLEIQDDSHLHAGHAGARGGAGHYTVRLESSSFTGKRPLETHRMVYAALDQMMGDEIHALSISARAPSPSNTASSA